MYEGRAVIEMQVQLLVSTMNQTDYSLLDKMKIFCDTIVINQCDKTGFATFEHIGHKVEWYDCAERGIGKSRNKALMAATADICVFADDDMVYDEASLGAVEHAFKTHEDADVLLFNIHGVTEIKKEQRLHTWNAYKYGAARMAIKRNSILRKRICFSLLFGGGAKYSCGEDTLFLKDCLKNRLRLYTVLDYLGTNSLNESTWFHGYNKKFFVDKGVLYAAMNPVLAKLYCVRYVFRNADLFEKEVKKEQALSWMFEGTREII